MRVFEINVLKYILQKLLIIKISEKEMCCGLFIMWTSACHAKAKLPKINNLCLISSFWNQLIESTGHKYKVKGVDLSKIWVCVSQ